MLSLFSEKVSENTKSRMMAKILTLERDVETMVRLPEFTIVGLWKLRQSSGTSSPVGDFFWIIRV